MLESLTFYSRMERCTCKNSSLRLRQRISDLLRKLEQLTEVELLSKSLDGNQNQRFGPMTLCSEFTRSLMARNRFSTSSSLLSLIKLLPSLTMALKEDTLLELPVPPKTQMAKMYVTSQKLPQLNNKVAYIPNSSSSWAEIVYTI